ncbi:MAG TPA: hypothetical protein VHP11_17890 [Tepidisphaeraceae bacterium]|nr:hypothetical protein [Tepidisphaeraceae bacterium]
MNERFGRIGGGELVEKAQELLHVKEALLETLGLSERRGVAGGGIAGGFG